MMIGLPRCLLVALIAFTALISGEAEVTVEETETVTSTSITTLYTCSECTSTKTTPTCPPASTTTVVQTAPPVTVTAECLRRKKVVMVTRTMCEKCHGKVAYTSAPSSLSSIYSEIMATMKPCVRCDNSPQCTEPPAAVEAGEVPPCRVCCSAPTPAK